MTIWPVPLTSVTRKSINHLKNKTVEARQVFVQQLTRRCWPELGEEGEEREEERHKKRMRRGVVDLAPQEQTQEKTKKAAWKIEHINIRSIKRVELNYFI